MFFFFFTDIIRPLQDTDGKREEKPSLFTLAPVVVYTDPTEKVSNSEQSMDYLFHRMTLKSFYSCFEAVRTLHTSTIQFQSFIYVIK
jgi:hypothetical protein